MNNPFIIEQSGKRIYLKLDQTPGSGINQLVGDITAGPGSGTQGAALVSIVGAGTFGDSTHVPRISIDAKGRITNATNVAISGGGGGGITQLTGDVTAGPGVGSQGATLASVSTPGTYGDATHVPQFVLDAKGRITGVNSLAIPGLTATSMPKASDLGILANGSDQTTNLNNAFLNSAYAGIIMDYVGGGVTSVTISGTVNCQGKMIFFQPKSMFIGSGILNGPVLAGGYRQQFFATTISLTSCQCATQYFSSMWYGAKPGGTDSQPAFQKSVDMANANPLMNIVYTPSGSYTSGAPITSYIFSSGQYQQNSACFIGDGSFWGINDTRINCTFNNGYAYGIQGGKGNIVDGIYFHGIFTPPATSGYAFYSLPFSGFTDGSSLDTRYAAYAGIMIDPYGPSVPSGGGYPTMTSFYRGSNTGGSTGIIIRNVILSNFVIGAGTSINGQTANAELMDWSDIQFANVKVCIVGGQAQEKLNSVRHVACWSSSYRFFDTDNYGFGQPGNWYIDGVNIAGTMVDLVSRNSNYFFPLFIRDVYAEGLFRIGAFTDSVGGGIFDSALAFVPASVATIVPNWHCTGGVPIRNTYLKYGDASRYRLSFNGIFSFDTDYFDDVPYVFSDSGNISYQQGIGNTTFKNCTIFNSSTVLGRTNDRYDLSQSFHQEFAYGTYRLLDTNSFFQGNEVGLDVKSPDPMLRMRIDLTGTANGATIAVSGTIATVTPHATADLARVHIGQMVIYNYQNVLGFVTAVGGSTFTVSYVPVGISSTTAEITIPYNLFNLSFMGDITAGSNIISNVVADFGAIASFISFSGAVKMIGFYGPSGFTQEGLMVSYDSSAHTITMDRNAIVTGTVTNIWFCNGNMKKILNQLGTIPLGNAVIVPRGSYLTNNLPAGGGEGISICTKTGYLGNIPKATYYEQTINPSLLLFSTKVTNYVLALTDVSKGVQMNTAGSNTVTLQPVATIPWELGSTSIIEQIGAGVTTITPGAGVTLTGLSFVTSGVGSILTLVYQGGDEWLVS